MSTKVGRLTRWKLSIEQYFSERPFFVPRVYEWSQDDNSDDQEVRTYELSPVQRFFVLLHEPSSCISAGWVSNFVLLVILVNVICNVYMTFPASRRYPVDTCLEPACDNDPILCPNKVMCAPTTEPSLVRIDDICVIIFSIEYVARLFSVWTVPLRLASMVPPQWDEEEHFCARHEDRDRILEPPQRWYTSVWGYFWQGKNLIDVVAIIPFYVTLIDPNADASLSFIRVLRLFRIVRAFNMNANTGVTSLIIKTVNESMEVILLLLFFSAMIILIYGSIIFDVEMGTYTVNALHPDGAYLRKNIEGEIGESPFTSTLVGMYWAVITMTTVGYGDIYPVANVGRVLAVTCAFVGVLFMALPISILGANFTVQYQRLSEQQRMERKKRATLLLTKKLESTSGKEIKVDVDYEVAKSMVKEDKAKGIGSHLPVDGSPSLRGSAILSNAIGGVRTATGNRMADLVIGERSQAEADRAAYLRNYEMVSLSDNTAVEDSGNLTPRSESCDGQRPRASSVSSVSFSGDDAGVVVKRVLAGCKTSEDKKEALLKMIRRVNAASVALSKDMEEELRVTTIRYRGLTENCVSLCEALSSLLEENEHKQEETQKST